MSEVTRILSAIEQGDPHAAEQLLPLVYDELRQLAAQKLAQEKPGQTLQATALVHEAYLRLVDVEKAQHWNSRGHFFAAVAEAMRRILVESARHKGRLKRGGTREGRAGQAPLLRRADAGRSGRRAGVLHLNSRPLLEICSRLAGPPASPRHCSRVRVTDFLISPRNS
jgi:RNA polymerase sigma factor (TIGR02999 family)